MNVVTRAVGLAAMRERLGLTQHQLAERLGLSKDQVAGLESGHISANPQLRLILMRYFGASFENLFEVTAVIVEEKSTPHV